MFSSVIICSADILSCLNLRLICYMQNYCIMLSSLPENIRYDDDSYINFHFGSNMVQSFSRQFHHVLSFSNRFQPVTRINSLLSPSAFRCPPPLAPCSHPPCELRKGNIGTDGKSNKITMNLSEISMMGWRTVIVGSESSPRIVP